MYRDSSRFTHKASRGFTIIEVLMVLTITAIIVGIATPSFMNVVANNRVTSASNELVIAMNLAKSEAVRSGHITVLCKSPAGNQCDDDANWSDGLLLFQDDDVTGDVGNDERIIKVLPASEASLNFANSNSAANSIIFRANGRTNSNGHFCFDNSHDQTNSRAVVYTQSGRIRAEKSTYDC